MSGPTPTASGNPNTHAANDGSESSCENLNRMATHEPASLATIPAEVVLNILGYLGMKKDWLGLARTCRRVSDFVVAELDKYSVEDGDYYALWYACVASKPAILLRHIALDAAVVNRHFTKYFQRERVRRVKLRSKWRFYPDLRRFGKGMTPLAVAVVAGSDGIVKLLLAHGADPNLPDLYPAFLNTTPWYPIHWAVASKHESSVATIRMLGAYSANIDQVPEDYDQKDISEYPKSMKCAPIFITLMLQKPQWDSRGKRQTSCEEFNDDLRQLQGLRLRQLEALLQCGADPNARHHRDRVTPVFFLLSYLANYNPSFYFEKSVTLSHEEDGQASVVNEIASSFLDMLRDFGADIHGLGNNYSHLDTLGRLTPATCPETALHAACRLKDRHKPIIDWFLRNGLSIDSLGKAQSTPLMAYCGSTFTDVDLFRKFLRNGPTINHSDNQGRTALHDLCANQTLRPQVREKAVKMMLDRGADPTFISNEGHVPAEELDTGGLDGIHEDVLVMLERATKSWNKRARKREEQESKNNERLALARSEIHSDPADNRRGHQSASHGNGRRESREDGYGDKKTGHGAGSPVSSRGCSHATTQGRNRGSRGENRRENRDSHQDTNHGSTQHSHGNKGNGQGKDRQKTSRDSHDKGAPQRSDQSTPRDTFYQKVRGGRYYSDTQRDHLGGNHENRGANREVNRVKT